MTKPPRFYARALFLALGLAVCAPAAIADDYGDLAARLDRDRLQDERAAARAASDLAARLDRDQLQDELDDARAQAATARYEAEMRQRELDTLHEQQLDRERFPSHDLLDYCAAFGCGDPP